MSNDNQKTCCCRSTDARRCYEIRYPPPICDLERSYYFEQIQEEDCQCECGCHEPHEYPDDDEDGETIWDVP